MADFLSLVPAIELPLKGQETGELGFLRFFRAFRALRILRAHRILSFYAPGSTRQLMAKGLQIVSLLFVVTGIVHAMEDIHSYLKISDEDATGHPHTHPFSQPCLSFFESLYFVVITFTTVGFGDIYPSQWLSRVVISAFVPIAIVMIPTAGAEIADIIMSADPNARPYEPVGEWTHIVVCGNMEETQLTRLLQQWYHVDMGRLQKKKVVVLSNSSPEDNDIDDTILQHPFYENRVIWVTGDVHFRESMESVCGLETSQPCAEAFFVLTDSKSDDPMKEDDEAIVRAVSIRRHNSKVQVIVQLLLAENRHRLQGEGIDVFCVEEIKFSLLGRGCVVPGLCTLMCQLFVKREVETAGALANDPWDEPDFFETRRDSELSWEDEYFLGSAYDMYQIDVDPSVEGLLFKELAWEIFQVHGAMCIGVEFPPEDSHKVKQTGRRNTGDSAKTEWRRIKQTTQAGHALEEARKDDAIRASIRASTRASTRGPGVQTVALDVLDDPETPRTKQLSAMSEAKQALDSELTVNKFARKLGPVCMNPINYHLKAKP